MKIEQVTNETKGIFRAKEGNRIIGKVIYNWSNPKEITIDHIEVDPEHTGQGVGKKLLMEVVKFARENKIKVIPNCPFAREVFHRSDEIKDVLLS